MFAWMTETLSTFTDTLRLTKSALTVDAYTADVRALLEYLVTRKIKRMGLLKPLHITAYLSACRNAGRSDSTISRYYMSIRSYFKHLRQIKRIHDDFMEDVPKPRYKIQAPWVPTRDEIRRLLTTPDTSTEAGCRDRAMLALLYSSGLRVSELCDLCTGDVRQGEITVRCGKGSKTRTVPITQEASQCISAYLQEHRGNLDGQLFLSECDKRMRRQLVLRIIQRHAKNAGLQAVTPHTLRHACATHLLDSGADIRMIQELLGHASISSTQRYTHLSSQSLRDAFHAFHPSYA